MAIRNQTKNLGLTIVEESEREPRELPARRPSQAGAAAGGAARGVEATSALAGGIAHVFNNMLTAIAVETELAMLHLPGDHPARKHLVEIEKVGERGAALARQLLAASGRQVLHPKLLQANDLVRDMEETIKRLLGDGIELDIVLAPDLARIEVDEHQLEQAILQLVANARDAMPDGGKLVIETANVAPDLEDPRAETRPGAVALRLSDTGVGMTEEVRRHVFEPFFTTKHEGSGLGLATVYGVVVQSGGTVEVESEPDGGSTFSIVLPAAEPALRTVDGRVIDPSVWQTVLLVEDEDNVRKPLAQILASRGYQVLEAAHAREAIQVSQRHQGPIHLMVTDILMGDMSGVELADRLSFQRPEMKVLYATGYPAGLAERPDLLSDDTPLLKKPFTGKILLAKVREVLENDD